MIDIKRFVKQPKGIALIVAVTLLLGVAFLMLYIFIVSPAAVRNPKLEHAHFRMQLVVDQKEVNFGSNTFQQTYEKGVCSAGLPETPIHFHDNKDDFVHLHWKGMTGGLVLKNYGWDYAGGPDDLLGYRLDELPKIKSVPIYGDVLPVSSENAMLWVYTGNSDSYQKRSADEFINQDLETFFGTKSLIKAEEEFSFWDELFPKAMARVGEAHEAGSSEEDLQRINNLLGDVIIFVQEGEPTDQQVKDGFSKLEPLSESTCGG